MEQKTPRLLTEAEVQTLWLHTVQSGTFEEHKARLRERGLIADDPVDPDLEEAREICALVCEGWADIPAERAHQYRDGSHDDEADIAYALAALKRGKELRPTLTREMVRDAWYKAASQSGGTPG
ncbi:hypothetical protein RZS08_09980, partial [Arthrospira platensis SPKY1]|nr:hypothetical protein [Arthrospira platensis SPKY1]